ncbi:MAG: NAD(+)/NADH kinase [Clostridia bacterium]|nr:NAD(+)/NADH kinase [Clostridia bacterium]
MKAAIILNREGVAQEIVLDICKTLTDLDILPCFQEEYSEEYTRPFVHLPFDKIMTDCDVILAIGGDGTILHAAKQAAFNNKKVLGINCGRLGYTAGLESDELELLKALKSGEYNVDKRMMLEVDVIGATGQKSTYYCVNDAVISKGALSRIIDITVCFDSKAKTSYRSDGIIVSTPTGSTAYSMSAGGPILDPGINGIIVTPICAHSFFTRPMVLNPDAEVTIAATVRNDSESYLTIDGEKAIKLRNDSKVVVRRAKEYTADLIKIKNDNFLQILHKKMIERRSGN